MGNDICPVENCSRPLHCRGYCIRHYQNLQRYGNPIPRHDRPLGERLRDVGWIVTDRGCWEWSGTRNQDGYGIFSARRFGIEGARAHRVVYEHLVGPIANGLVLRHRCDNPPCVNPWHLEPGTKAENSRDMVERGRHYLFGRTECRNGHDLTAPGATRTLKGKSRKETRCVECMRAKGREYARRKRAADRLARCEEE